MKSLLQRALVYVLALSVLGLSSPVVVEAQIIGTLAAVEAQQRDKDLATVNGALAREEVRQKMTEMGVDAQQLDARIAAMTDSELRSLATDIESMPAGGDALAVIGIVFLVLLILEAVGVIDIFKKFP
ncbi:hypothetical protein HNQ60_005347 [Povalibacter uvarum]|jgi:hypothetical protein|uniref:PA2779 family protein n=1 Tax=Povalibacter uvarum TaxID=732238 RepID=A0A841HXB1_9GAMM|nr:PA2779 family protein [Povalibacter uvarum]MBB6096425.1 hypothetical protein [Povalibacter uvarum]